MPVHWPTRALHFAISLAVILALDAVWLSVNKQRYGAMVASMQGGALMRVKLLPAIVAYVLMGIAVVFLILPSVMTQKAVRNGRPTFFQCIKVASLYGLVVYGIYNATNLAIFANYPISIAVMDTAWGIFLFCAVVWITTLLPTNRNSVGA